MEIHGLREDLAAFRAELNCALTGLPGEDAGCANLRAQVEELPDGGEEVLTLAEAAGCLKVNYQRAAELVRWCGGSCCRRFT